MIEQGRLLSSGGQEKATQQFGLTRKRDWAGRTGRAGRSMDG
jgi:hypothetical protein